MKANGEKLSEGWGYFYIGQWYFTVNDLLVVPVYVGL